MTPLESSRATRLRELESRSRDSNCKRSPMNGSKMIVSEKSVTAARWYAGVPIHYHFTLFLFITRYYDSRYTWQEN